MVNKSHTTLNSSNAAFSDSNTHFIYAYDSAQFGNINDLSVNQHPQLATSVGGVNKYANLSQLSITCISDNINNLLHQLPIHRLLDRF